MFGRSIELQADQVLPLTRLLLEHDGLEGCLLELSVRLKRSLEQCSIFFVAFRVSSLCMQYIVECCLLRLQVAGSAARFSFQQLCRATLRAADYQALAARFHTVFVTDIPALSLAVRPSCSCKQNRQRLPDCNTCGTFLFQSLCSDRCHSERHRYSKESRALQTRDHARRCIVLIDKLYNAHVHLVSCLPLLLQFTLPKYWASSCGPLKRAAQMGINTLWLACCRQEAWPDTLGHQRLFSALPGVHGSGGTGLSVCGIRERGAAC